MNTQTLPLAPRVPTSMLVMGSTQLMKRHTVKGLFFLFIQLAFIVYLPEIIQGLHGLITLGDVAQTRKGFDIIQGDNSISMLVNGIFCLVLVMAFLVTYYANVQDAKTTVATSKTFTEQLKDIYETKFAFIMLSPAALAAIGFIILPIIITILVSFTNYSAPHHIPPKNLVDWVGFKNFNPYSN